MIKTALLSVSDKTGIVAFAKALSAQGVKLLSTGGTAKALRDAGLDVTDVSDHTGFPEIMDGRVKTLHPKVHGGLLGRRKDKKHMAAMKEHKISPIDLVAINLYPFEATVAKGADFEECIENIDIGGPSMIRSAAKNHESVTVLTDPADYDAALAEMKAHKGATTPEFRKQLAMKAFTTTGKYDTAISAWFISRSPLAGEQTRHEPSRGGSTPPDLATAFSLAKSALPQGEGKNYLPLRYGENPHQQATLYLTDKKIPGVATAKQLQGKELSYNNIADTDAAFDLVSEFDQPACAIIKHANPCGVAIGKDVVDAYKKALACDPVSAYGGILAFNRPFTGAMAKELGKLFAEVIIAPKFEKDALEVLAAKKNLRLLETSTMPDVARGDSLIKSVAGGLLVQSRDNLVLNEADIKVVSKRKPTAQELKDLIFAFTVCKHVKSNAIVYAKNEATVGIGAGQMSRVDSCRIGAWKAKELVGGDGVKGSVVASDAFFPFADGLIAAADHGVTAAIHPGGSIRDEEVIAAADERNLAMVMTGYRHFRH